MALSLMSAVVGSVRDAGRLLLSHYRSPALRVRRKADDSEVTDADEQVSAFLREALPRLYPAPVLCEEAVVPYADRRSWTEFWMVDPLDGTRDFIAANDEFSVCVALIRDGSPRLAVVYGPALDEWYEAETGAGAFRTLKGRRQRLPVTACLERTVARSRFHDGPEVTDFMKRNGITRAVAVGSALKFGRVAAGEATLFPRMRGCSEWDVAPGHLILKEAGGSVTLLTGGEPRYNSPEARVEGFLAVGPGAEAKSFKW